MRPDGSDAFPHLTITSRISPFAGGLAFIKTEEAKGYINREGKWDIGGTSATPLPEDGGDFQPFSEDLARFRAGEIAINQGFFDPPLFKNGYAVVRRVTVDDKSDIRIVGSTAKERSSGRARDNIRRL